MSAYSDAVLAHANVIHYWRFGGNGTDSAGSSNATLAGGATYGTGLLTGDSDQALALTPTPTPSYATASIAVGSAFSFVAWYNYDTNNPQVVFDVEPTNSIVNVLIENGVLQTRVNSNSASVSMSAPTAATRHMVAVTMSSGGTVKFYVDNTLIGTTTATPPTTGTYTINFGRYGSFGGGYYASGALDEVSMYSTDVSSTHIGDLWLIGTTGSAGFTAGVLSEVSHTAKKAVVSWTSSTGGTGSITEQLQRSPAGAGTWTNVSGSSPVTNTGLTPATTYDYRVVFTDTGL
jgi:hypothetical protein